MTTITGQLFNPSARGLFGETVLIRQSMAHSQNNHRHTQTNHQDSFRQAMTVAHKCVKVCGPATQEQLNHAAPTATWHNYLVKNLMGTSLASYTFYLQNYTDPKVDQAGWEAAAVSSGLQPISLDSADGASVSPGMQLFLVASTLFSLGLYTAVGRPNGNPKAWKEHITS